MKITGIGTRTGCHDSVKLEIINILEAVHEKDPDSLLISGGAEGMDQLFEEHFPGQVLSVRVDENLSMPVWLYNDVGGAILAVTPSDKKYEIAYNLYKKAGIILPFNYDDVFDLSGRFVGNKVAQLILRNAYQIIDGSAEYKTDAVLYYTDAVGAKIGGTRYALLLAKYLDIPCYNMASDADIKSFYEDMIIN